MEADKFIGSLTNKIYNQIRQSNGDAECRRLLKEHLAKQSSITAVGCCKEQLCKCGKEYLVYNEKEGLDICTICGTSKLA